MAQDNASGGSDDLFDRIMKMLSTPEGIQSVAMRASPPAMPTPGAQPGGGQGLTPPPGALTPPMVGGAPAPAISGNAPANPLTDPKLQLALAQMMMAQNQGAPPPHPGSAPIAGGRGQMQLPNAPLPTAQQRLPDLGAILSGRI